jgi:hypothetical protein
MEFLMPHLWELQSTIFLTSALTGDEWLASRPGRFTPGERAPGALGGPQSWSLRRGENS